MLTVARLDPLKEWECRVPFQNHQNGHTLRKTPGRKCPPQAPSMSRLPGFWNFCDALLIVFMFVDAACALGGIFMFGVDDALPDLDLTLSQLFCLLSYECLLKPRCLLTVVFTFFSFCLANFSFTVTGSRGKPTETHHFGRFWGSRSLR